MLFVLSSLLIGCGHKNDAPPAEIAVSNSYLHALVRDLCGDEIEIFNIVPPGHFDIKPADVRRLFECRLLLAFDFQAAIGNVLADSDRGPTLHTITAPPGMVVPDSYLAMAEQTAAILIAEYPERRAFFQQRLDAMAERIAALKQEAADLAATLALNDAAVLTSRHQAVFAEWLGMNVVATFSGRDAETAANINAALRRSNAHALRCIIANRQEGDQLANALGDRLKTPVVMFSNFPDAASYTADAPGFDALLRDNLRRLAEAAQ
jgi:ABC-type Zn uptake system ZnuABC Zn-binding protein ZnuA